jgi:hypothetical protein
MVFVFGYRLEQVAFVGRYLLGHAITKACTDQYPGVRTKGTGFSWRGMMARRFATCGGIAPTQILHLSRP